MKRIRVVVVGDYRLFRAGIKSLLRGLGGIEVVAEADNELEALSLLKTYHPDVALIHTVTQTGNLDAIKNLMSEFPKTRVIVLSMSANEESKQQILHSGVSWYLQKESDVEELQRAIISASEGKRFVRTVSLKQDHKTKTPLDLLTPRQCQVLKMIVEGRSNREIAKKLSISIRTVETHRFQIMERLGIRNIAGLVRLAMQSGLVKSND